jgi:small-conductance mechanosensitive channel
MVLQDTSVMIADAFSGLWFGVISFIPNIIIAVVILIIGFVVSALIGRVIERVFLTAKIDQTLKRAGLDVTLSRAGIILNSGKFIGGLVKWFVIVVFLIVSFDVLHLSQVNEFLKGVVVGYLPQVIAAVLILLVAAMVADAIEKLVTSSAKAANMKPAKLLGAISRTVIWIVGILAALDQLGIGQMILQTLFTGIVVAFSLAFGLAFGLGGQDAACDVIAKVRSKVSEKD